MLGVYRCSFCGKYEYEVNEIICGPGVYICDKDIALCVEILEERDETRQRVERVRRFAAALSKSTAGKEVTS